MSILIQRVTTRYSEIEDRICLQAELSDQTVVEFWLTRRFLDRLLPALIKQLDQSQEADAHYQMLQVFNQQAAISSMKTSEPVASPSQVISYLISTVDIQANQQQIRLIFKVEDKQFILNFDNTELRQWLWIVHNTFIAATWHTEVWPAWFKGEISSPASMH